MAFWPVRRPPLLSLAVVSGGLLVLMALALRLLRAGYKLRHCATKPSWPRPLRTVCGVAKTQPSDIQDLKKEDC